MYAQVVRSTIQAGKLDEAIAVFKDSVAPAAREREGFQMARLLVDRASNKIMGMSFWDSEADVVAMMSSGFYQEQVAKFGALFAGPPEREVYEVAAEA